MTSQISRQAVFDIWVVNNKNSRTDAIVSYILKELGGILLPENILSSLRVTVRSLCQKIEEKWAKSGRHRERFLKANSLWLQGTVSLPDNVIQVVPSNLQTGTSNKPGRPPIKDFEACSSKTKQRRVKHLVESTSHEELSVATEMQLRKIGKRDSASIVKELIIASPRRGTTIKKARKSLFQKEPELSEDQALALMVDANLSTHQYNVIRHQAKNVNSKLYPPYYKVKAAKQLCYPSQIAITEISAEIELQALIDHTVTRLCTVQEEVLKTLHLPDTCLHIIIKWGCDGAEQNRYRQKFTDDTYSDESLFSISMVPIQIYSVNGESKNIIWQNQAPSSTRYCRPIKFVFAKETHNLIKTEVQKIEEEIATLSSTKIIVNDLEVSVKPIMVFCMIDGKICNAVSSCASTQTCYLCGAKPRDMNNINIVSQKPVEQNLLALGLSPLHSWIRFFECILHIAYRLDIKSWQARGTEKQNMVAQKKKHIQESFKREFGLVIDMPKQQTGNTNDGNTARKFFRNAEKSAEITGVNVELIKRFHVILECLNSGFQINIEKFEEYTRETRELYLREYSWYSMPVSVHKILFHGKDIVASSILPIGQLSEEAQEARNKDNRKYRELFTRKTSRIDTNTDLLHRLLITSDPLIASLRAAPKTKRGQISQELCELLEQPSLNLNRSEELTSSDDDSE